MAHILQLKQAYWRTRSGVVALIRGIAHAVAAEHTRAHRATAKAASPRQSLDEVRAMYVSANQPRQESDGVAQGTKSAR